MDSASPISSALMSLLGVGPQGEEGQNRAFQNYLDNSAYGHIRDQGLRAITSNSALGGLLSSGSTLKSASEFTSGLNKQFLDDYMSRLSGQQSAALQAGNLVSGAGQVSESEGWSKASSTGKSSSFSI